MRECRRQTAVSVYPRQDLLQVCKELLPPALGALVGLFLIRPEARLLHAQVGPRARRGESPSDDTLETIGRPRVRQRFARLDCQDLTVDSAPVCAKIETVVHDRLEVVLHEPLLDQVWLRERAPDLFRRIRYLPFDNDGERFGRSIAHWSILLRRSSSALWSLLRADGASGSSHRRVQCHGGANERLQRLFIDLVALMDIDGTSGVAFEAGVEEAGRVLQRGALGEGHL